MQIQVDQRIEIVYQDKSGKITQRKIEVHSIYNGQIRATCLTKGLPRLFLYKNILAWQPISKRGAIA